MCLLLCVFFVMGICDCVYVYLSVSVRASDPLFFFFTVDVTIIIIYNAKNDEDDDDFAVLSALHFVSNDSYAI